MSTSIGHKIAAELGKISIAPKAITPIIPAPIIGVEERFSFVASTAAAEAPISIHTDVLVFKNTALLDSASPQIFCK